MSAEKKKHDFHLVDPSPWPIYVSFATLVLAVGAVYYFHSKALWLLLVGFALVVYGAFMWWRDVIEEAEHQGHHTPVVQIGHRYGMTLFIASEVMFFVAWFWAYFDISLFPNEFVGNVWSKHFQQIHLGTNLYQNKPKTCLLYTSPSPRDKRQTRMPSSA